MLDELELSEANAEAIIEKAIEFEVYTDDMPETKKDKMEAAHEIVAFAIDSWVDDGTRPDSDDEQVAAAGEQISEIFALAGIEMDDNEIVYGDPPDLDGAADDSDDGDGDESPFDINDVIDGYEDLTAATKIKKIKALDLDADDDDDYNVLVGIAEWEEDQESPTSRVLDYLTDIIGEPDDDKSDDSDDGESAVDGDAENAPWDEASLKKLEKDDLKEVAEQFGVEFPKRLTDAGRKRVYAGVLEAQNATDAEEAGEGDDDEPWEGYNDAEVDDVIEVINDDDRTLEELEYVLEYENGADEPDADIVKALEKRIKQLSEPEKPARRGRRGATKSKDPDDSDDVDNAVAKDDAKDAKVSRRRASTKKEEPASEGGFTVTYEVGDNEMESVLDGKFAVAGFVLDAIESGAERIVVIAN